MKERYGILFVILILFSRDCHSCFTEDSVTNRSFTSGSSIYEDCCCVETGGKGVLMWWDPNHNIIQPLGPGTESNVYIEENGDCVSLHIPRSTPSMSGTYKCSTTYKGLEHYEIHNLDIYEPLYFINTAEKQAITVDSDGLIHCEAKGASTPYIRWYRGTDGLNEINKSTDKYKFEDGGLRVMHVNMSDSGIYRCSASVFSTGEELDVDIDVTINTPPVITQLKAEPEPTILIGEYLAIRCAAEGNPVPEYVWNKISNTKADEDKNVTWRQEDGNIYFDQLEANDTGNYECTAENEVGFTKRQIFIEVLVPPEITLFNNITAVDGNEIPIACMATGFPSPNVTITYEGKSLEEERESPFEEFVPNMMIFKVDRSKDGIYVCNATNEAGFSTQAIYLSVQYPPIFNVVSEDIWGWDGEEVTLSCEHESNPPAKIGWTYKSFNATSERVTINEIDDLDLTFSINNEIKPFGEYTCTAENLLGKTSKTINLRRGFPPSPVQNATTKEESATSWTFDLAPPLDYEGPNVIGFIAEYDAAENYNITDVHPSRTWATERPYKLEKLKPNTTYFVKFAAINRVGTGSWGELISFDTLEKSAPEPPIFQVDAHEVASSMILKWKAPEDNGEPIDYYALRYCRNSEEDESCQELRLDTTTEVKLYDLQPNITYYFELIAHNAEGNSTPANISLAFPVEILTEAAPLLSGSAIIGISVIVVVICLLLLDLLLFFWKRLGIIASCFRKNGKKKKPDALNSRDKKGLLKDNGESGPEDTLRPNNGHKEFEYNKTTGIITGKHSAV